MVSVADEDYLAKSRDIREGRKTGTKTVVEVEYPHLEHKEFLHDGSGDPRELLASSLLKTQGRSGSIVVYSGFEETRIREMAEAFPHLSKDPLALLDGRIVDLLAIARECCYHPDFHGSFSLKAVLPGLVPDLGYEYLEIRDGAAASVAYAEIIDPGTSDDRRTRLIHALLLQARYRGDGEVGREAQ